MQPFWLIVMFVLGGIVGSFLNVCIYRLPRDKSLWNPRRSFCPHCHEQIAWYDNIPLVSWFALNAQCRHCGSHIAGRYVAVELLTAVTFSGAYALLSARGESPQAIAVYLGLFCVLIVGSFIDIELRIMPNSLTLGGAMLAPVISVLAPQIHSNTWWAFGRGYMFTQDQVWGPLLACFIGMAVGSAATWLSGWLGKRLFRKEAMGLGDVKFMALLGGILGWQQVLLVFFLAPLFGAVIGIIHMLRTRDHHIPYGPFLSAATVIAIFFGDKIFAAIGITELLGSGPTTP